MTGRTTGRDKFKKYGVIIKFFTKVFSVFPNKLNSMFLIWNRETKGVLGLVMRYILLKNLSKSCGDNVSIQPGVYLFNLHNLRIGHNVSIHPMCYIDAAGCIEIGDNVSIAHNTSILSTNHTWNDLSVPIKYNEEAFGKVKINEDVWIGCGVRILAGVSIESRSVIAAGSVVNKNVQSNSIIAGIPGKKIKSI